MITVGRVALPVSIVALATVVGVGAATGQWTRGGSGSGTARSATAQALVLSTATPSAQLYPGGQADVALTATNPGTIDLVILSLRLDTAQGTAGFAVDDKHSGCDLGALSFTGQTNGGAGWAVPAGTSSRIALNGSLSLNSTASDACQGANFKIFLVAGP